MSPRLLPTAKHRVFSISSTGLNIYEADGETGEMKFLRPFAFKTDTFFSKVDNFINSGKERLIEIEEDQSFLVVRFCDNLLYMSLTSGWKVLYMYMSLIEWQLARKGLLRLCPAEDKCIGAAQE